MATKSLVAFAGTLLLVSTALTQQTAEARSVSYELNIPAENLDAALQALALASHHKLLYRAELVAGKASRALVGTYTTEEAVGRLLEGTKLSFEITPASVVLIKGLDEKPITSVPAASVQTAPSDDASTKMEGGKKSSQDFRLAQVDQGSTKSNDSVKSQDKADKGPPQPTEGLAEILVKGSRIMNLDVTRTEDDVQPYTIFNAEQIEQSGATNVEDFLKQYLTMNTSFQSVGQTVSSGGNTSSINLRGLGANETLILIDGRRAARVSYLGTAGQPDINGIPLAAIERIEVLPTSASAIYGGAAVGGVVNIILKRNFTGGDVRATYDIATGGDAPLRTVNATYGWSLFGDKTRIMLSGQIEDGGNLLLEDRLNLVHRGISSIFQNDPSFLYSPFLTFPGATPNIASAEGNLVLKNGTALNSPITYVPAGTSSATPGATLANGLLGNAGTYNLNLGPGTAAYGLQNPLETAPHDKSFMATIRQELTPTLEAFTQFSTRSNWSDTPLNPFSTTYVPSSAPENPFQQDVFMNFPSALAVPIDTNSVMQSVTQGFLLRLPGSWGAEVDYTWSRSSFAFREALADSTGFQTAINDGSINPFVDTISHPLNLAPYVGYSTYSINSTLNDLGLRASGPIGSFPWGAPSLTVGLEHRKEGSHDGYSADVFPTATDDFHTTYFGQSQSTDSLYMEALVPLVTAKNAVPGIRSLDLQLAGRSERYTVNAGTPFAYYGPDGTLEPYSPPQGVRYTIKYTSTNPTIGLKYKPVEDLIARVSYSRAFLPPTAQQLLPASGVNMGCGGPCLTEITDPRDGQSYNVETISGGNPQLQPQTAQDWNLGLIWEPQQELLKGLRIDLESYKIKQPNYITTPDPQQVVDNATYAGRVTGTCQWI